MRERRIETGDVTLAVAEAGADGGAPLLLLHGFTGAKEDFGDWMDALADEGWHAVAPDHRGHGSSDHPPDEEHYSLVTMAADVEALADALGWDRFALLGHSMGGMVAQRVALDAPGRLDRLILMDTAHGPVEGIEPELVALATEIVRTQGLDALADIMAKLQSPLSSPADLRVREERPGYVEFGERKFRSCSPAMYTSMAAEMFSQHDRLSELAELDVATLVVVGEQDDGFIGPSRRLAETIPGARLAVIADAGHSPQFEAPEDWWAAISGFLAEQLTRR